MKNVSDLLKSESFRENQLYPFLISKFKKGTIPTDINEFLRCCSWDKENYVLEFCYNFGELESEKVHILFGTSKTRFKCWTHSYLVDRKDIYSFDYDYIKIVIQQIDCVDRINRLISIAGTYEIGSSIFWTGANLENPARTKYYELYDFAQKRISQLENQERKEQEDHIM